MAQNLILVIFYYTKSFMEIFQFIIFHIKLQQTQNLCILGSIIHGVIKYLDDRIKHLILFNYGLFNKICDKIKYLISKKKVEL